MYKFRLPLIELKCLNKVSFLEFPAEKNLKDIETDSKGNIRYSGIWWMLGKYDTVVMFEAPDEKGAMNMV